MTPLAANRELFARKEGNGVTGFVAATGQSYLCPDTTKDPLYLEGAAGSRSSLTVPLIYHGTVIGTLNVESPQPNAFDDRDRQFLEIYGRNIASALNTLELLQAEKVSTATASVEAISRELALPLDDIITDATTVLDRYAGHDEDIIARLRHLLYRAREIRSLIHKVGSSIAPQPKQSHAATAPRLAGTRILVVDADEAIRRSAHHLLGVPGGHRRDRPRRPRGHRADAADPVLGGPRRYPAARPRRLRDLSSGSARSSPDVPIILMTGFGYDPSHSIVKARQEGLQTVLYKPFRADRLMEAVEQALRIAPASALPRPARRTADDGHCEPVGAEPTRASRHPSHPPPPAPSPRGRRRPAEQAGQEGQAESRPTEISHHES